LHRSSHLAELAGVGPYAQHLAGAAAAIALVTPDPATADAPLSVMWDLGRAAQNMTLAAWELGIGSVPATVYDQPLAKELLGLPADRHCEFMLSFGYPADPAALTWAKRAGGRKPLELSCTPSAGSHYSQRTTEPRFRGTPPASR